MEVGHHTGSDPRNPLARSGHADRAGNAPSHHTEADDGGVQYGTRWGWAELGWRDVTVYTAYTACQHGQQFVGVIARRIR